VAALQGYLLKNKVRPRESVDEVSDWIIQERETREKLKKEKAEREAKEKKEAEEKERKEKEEKVAKEQEEKELREKLERKDRKSKKAHRAEAAMKLEGKLESTAPAAATSTSTFVDAVIPVTRTPSASSSESDMSSGGIEADTEESMTSEEEPDKPADATPGSTTKGKWVAVKGQQAPSLGT